jgi:AAA ATPase domain
MKTSASRVSKSGYFLWRIPFRAPYSRNELSVVNRSRVNECGDWEGISRLGEPFPGALSRKRRIEFDHLTVVIGKNDSGKSAILEAIELFLNKNDPDKDDAGETLFASSRPSNATVTPHFV